MIGAAAHTGAMLGVEGAAGSCWERRGATPWPQERSDTCLNMCQCVACKDGHSLMALVKMSVSVGKALQG